MANLKTSAEADGNPVLGTDEMRLARSGANFKISVTNLFLTKFASPAFTGTPTAPTAAPGTNTTQLATTAYADAAVAAEATARSNADALKAPLASPALTGTPTAPTAAPATNTTQVATTAYADALGALKANIASPTFTGTPAAPTAAPGANSTQIATTAYADAIAALKANLASPTFTGTVTAVTLALTGLISKINNLVLAGFGVPAIVAAGRFTAQVAAKAVVATFTPAADGSFEVSANMLITASTTFTIFIQCTYTDEGNTARTLTLLLFPVSAIGTTNAGNAGGAVPYHTSPMTIRAKSGTAITIATSGTFTSVTYNIEGFIKQIA